MQPRPDALTPHPVLSALTDALRNERPRFVAQARRALSLHGPADAEDMVQEASMVVCHTVAVRSDGPKAMAPWLGGCVRLLVHRHRRETTRSERHLRLVGPATEDTVPPPDALRDRDRALAAMPGLIDTLAPRAREALRAHFMDGCPWPEVARRLGITVDQARHAAEQGLVALRAHGVTAGLWTAEDVALTSGRDSTRDGRLSSQVGPRTDRRE